MKVVVRCKVNIHVVHSAAVCRQAGAHGLGFEAGQRLVVAGAFALWKSLSRFPRATQARTRGQARALALYAIGGLAAYWSIDRVAALLA